MIGCYLTKNSIVALYGFGVSWLLVFSLHCAFGDTCCDNTCRRNTEPTCCISIRTRNAFQKLHGGNGSTRCRRWGSDLLSSFSSGFSSEPSAGQVWFAMCVNLVSAQCCTCGFCLPGLSLGLEVCSYLRRDDFNRVSYILALARKLGWRSTDGAISVQH